MQLRAAFICIAIAVCCLVVIEAAVPVSYVTYDQAKHQYEFCSECGCSPAAVAWGTYNDQINETGWSYLQIRTNENVDDSVTMFAAGFLEGALTWERMVQFNYTYQISQFDPSGCSHAIRRFVRESDAWTLKMVKNNAATDDYWYQVGLVMSQVDGLLAGYNLVYGDHAPWSREDLLLLNLMGDMIDLQNALDTESRPDWMHMSPVQRRIELIRRSRCSALVKVTPDNSDLYVSHTTWSAYQQGLLRIHKIYDLPVGQKHGTAARRMVMSSYPGIITSIDDFFMTDQQLAITETTNDVFTYSVYDSLTPQSVSYWIRSLVANRMASSSRQWLQVFAKHNSGTYNNQWMVVDYKLYTPGAQLSDNLFWIGEQLPGEFPMMDATPFLRLGYWPSYNVPYFEHVWNVSGYRAMYHKYGNEFSYSMCPRAEIFRRDQATVSSVDSLQHLMLYNDWENDPLSGGTPDGAIASRADLDPSEPFCGGGTDNKLTNAALMKSLSAWIYSGPTHTQQPAFDWREFPDLRHDGQPDVFDFGYVLVDGSVVI